MPALSSASDTLIENLLSHADIHLNGDRPWDITVHNDRLFPRVIAQGSLGLGESYMDGWWDCEALDEFFARLIRAEVAAKLPKTLGSALALLQAKILNLQTINRSRTVGKQHYDLGNDFYEAMLDPFMQYSCGYFKDTNDLRKAQEQKLDLICRKLQLKKGEKLLDIGCGWGGLAKFAAQQYGCAVTGVTISKEQAAFAKTFCKGLPVDIRLTDYRTLDERFDKIVSVGMFEHVGPKNYDAYMDGARRCISDDGLFLLHTIGDRKLYTTPEPWLATYIFPNSVLPAMSNLTAAAQKYFVMEDWHNFGAYYEKTLLAWHVNFTANWKNFKEKYGDRFERMWRYYLLSCAGGFRARRLQLWQVVVSPHGVNGGYSSIR